MQMDQPGSLVGHSLPRGSDRPNIVGTNAWAAAGGPPLSTYQGFQQRIGAQFAYLADLPGELRWRWSRKGVVPSRKIASVGTLALPETAAVERAVRELERFAEGETEMSNHSHRTFHFADILHRQAGAPPLDREVLAVGMLLHDIGMFPKAVAELPGNEFTIRGAHLARRIAEDAGWSQTRTDLVAQVITLNANGRVSRRWGAEAYFGRLAPLVDAVGQVWKVHPDDAREIFSDRPLGPLDETILQMVTAEAERQPGGRFAIFRPLFPFLVHSCRKRWHTQLGTGG